MNRVCLEAEKVVEPAEFSVTQSSEGILRVDEAIAKSAAFTALNLHVKAVAAMTQSGSTALWMSRISTHVPIYALTPETATRRKVTLFRGVYPATTGTSSLLRLRMNFVAVARSAMGISSCSPSASRLGVPVAPTP